MGISVSESQSQRERIEQLTLKKVKAMTNSQIVSEQKKTFNDIHNQEQNILGVTNIKGRANHLLQPNINNQKRPTHSSQKLQLKTLKIEHNEDEHQPQKINANNSPSKLSSYFQTIDHIQISNSKLNNNEPFKRQLRNVPSPQSNKVSFIETRPKSKEKDNKQLSKDISRISLKNSINIERKETIKNEPNQYSIDKNDKGDFQKQSLVTRSMNKGNKTIEIQQKQETKEIKEIKGEQQSQSIYEQDHSRLTNNGSKTLTVKKNPLRLQKEEVNEERKVDMQFQNFDWKIPKSTVNKIVPTHKKLRPEASIVLINKMGQEEQSTKQQTPKKTNWKSRRELMNEIVSGRLDSAQAGFSFNQCLPKMKESEVYRQACI